MSRDNGKELSVQSETIVKKGKKIRYIILAACVIIALILGIIVYKNFANIKALYYGTTVSMDDIRQGVEDNEIKTREVLDELTDTKMQELTDEERQKLALGELSEKDALKIIAGAQTDTEPTKPETTFETSRKDELIAQIYLLRARYINSIDSLVEEGKAEIRNLSPTEKKSLFTQLDLAQKYLDRGTALEKQCDAQIESLLNELSKELERTNGNIKLISEIRTIYSNEKELKKAELVSTYYPR